ncbi:hypothetical protein B0J11DRAFT_83403 [Dendryphion nanum]|uniref:Uncharacterized protein n=1 Tax=Dendryphion nanum TaxID=256645 RepID=A0A9P9IGR1_9PLEO|nr:hypothetical protein B0J11DRAFT_83403 [Dendryphion nanum]
MSDLHLGPLTTLFTPPSSCLNIITSVAVPGIYNAGISLFLGNLNGAYTQSPIYLSAATSCYPIPTTAINFWSNYYYSPAYCPLGWTAACTFPQSTDVAKTRTASLCCPEGFRCVNGWVHGCQRETSGVVSLVFVARSREAVLTDYGELTAVSLKGIEFVYNDGIPVAWQETDREVLEMIQRASRTTVVGGASTSSAMPSRPSGSRDVMTSSFSSASVSSEVASRVSETGGAVKEAKSEVSKMVVPIAVGVGIMVLIFAIGMVIFVSRKRKGRLMNEGDRSGLKYSRVEMNAR